jgi:hypothetical protein
MPSASNVGYVDVIVENPVSYGNLTDNVRINTFNPYVTGTSLHDNFVPYQVPYLSGIKIT